MDDFEQNASERRERLKQMILLGKERGWLTCAEIGDHLPDDVQQSEQVDGIVGMINDMGIEVRGEFVSKSNARAPKKNAIIDGIVKIVEEKEVEVAQETAKILPFIRPNKPTV